MSDVRLERLAFDSFLHSQGDPYIQALLLKWVEVNHSIPYQDLVGAVATAAARIERYVVSSQHLPVTDPTQTVQETIDALHEPPYDHELQELGKYLVHHDRLILQDKTRPTRKIYQGRRNPSHVVLFGLLNASTGSDIYNGMYASVVEPYRIGAKQTTDTDRLSMFTGLLQEHIRYNPNDAVVVQQTTGLL